MMMSVIGAWTKRGKFRSYFVRALWKVGPGYREASGFLSNAFLWSEPSFFFFFFQENFDKRDKKKHGTRKSTDNLPA
jgi:hypothetical protein